MQGKIKDPGECLSDNKQTDVMVVIDEDRKVWRLSSRLIYVPYDGVLHAFGAGQEIAIGAMMAGATAIEAINITAVVSDYAARGISSVEFD